MALVEVLQFDDIPAPLALAPEITSTDASPKDWRLSLVEPAPVQLTNRFTPIDQASGLPLLVAATGYDDIAPEEITEHHGWHPRRKPVFRTLAGAALRASWHIMLPPELHNAGKLSYHSRHLRPKEVPGQEDDVYSRIVLACAFVLPARVIDLSEEKPVVRAMTAPEHDFYNTPDLKYGRRYIRFSSGPIEQFFKAYIDKQGGDDGHQKNAREFLRAKSDQHRRELGHVLLSKSVEAVPRNIRRQFALQKRAALLEE